MCFAAAKLMPSGQPQQGASMSGGPYLTWAPCRHHHPSSHLPVLSSSPAKGWQNLP